MIKGLFVPNTELERENKIVCKTDVVPCPYKLTCAQRAINTASTEKL